MANVNFMTLAVWRLFRCQAYDKKVHRIFLSYAWQKKSPGIFPKLFIRIFLIYSAGSNTISSGSTSPNFSRATSLTYSSDWTYS